MTEVQQKPTLGVRFRGRCPPHRLNNSRDQLLVSVLGRCLSYRGAKNMTERPQGVTLGVPF